MIDDRTANKPIINYTVGSESNHNYRILNVLNFILKIGFKIFQLLKWS